MKKKRNGAASRATKKVCNKCGGENALNARQCKYCKSKKFAPNWVVVKRPVNRQVSVEVTISNPRYGPPRKRITLSKWWPGNSTSFHIPNAAQWEKIEGLINQQLAPMMGWKGKKEVLAEIEKSRKKEKTDIRKLVQGHPDILKRIVEAIDHKRLGSQELDTVVETFGEISDALTSANAGFREAFLTIVKRLPRQRQRALEDLERLLQDWSLHTVTNVAQQVQARLQTIELFEKQIQDDKTFEIIGDKSIHRILERAMWLVDERYWLLHSNSTLRKFIGDKLSKKDKKKYGRKRPDFVCGTIGNKLIILELKRPAHTLSVDDLNQLELYMVLAEQYKNFSSYEAYLVGSSSDDELRRTQKHRSSNFKVLYYADIIEKTRERYREFLQTIEGDR